MNQAKDSKLKKIGKFMLAKRFIVLALYGGASEVALYGLYGHQFIGNIKKKTWKERKEKG